MCVGQQLGFGTSPGERMHRDCLASRAILVVGGRLEPLVFPEEIALSLAATMGQTITIQAGEVDRSLETATFPGLTRCITGLVGNRTDMKTLPTILQHLRHKRHSV